MSGPTNFRIELTGGSRDLRSFTQQHRDTYQKLLAYITPKEFIRLQHNRDREQFSEKCISQGCLLSTLMPFLEYFFHDYLGRDHKYYFFGNILPRFLDKHREKISEEALIAEIHSFYEHFNEPDLYLILCRYDLKLFETYFDKHKITIHVWSMPRFVQEALSHRCFEKEYKREIVKKMIFSDEGFLKNPSFFINILNACIEYDQCELIQDVVERCPELLHDYHVLQKLHKYQGFTMQFYHRLLHAFYEEKKYDSYYDGKNHIQFLLHTQDQKECIDYMKLMNMDYYIKMIAETVELKLMEVLDHIFSELRHLDAGYFASEHLRNLFRFATIRYEEEDYEKLAEVLGKYGISEEVMVRYPKGASLKDDRCGICLEGNEGGEEQVVPCKQCGTGFHLACLRTLMTTKKRTSVQSAEFVTYMGLGEDEDEEEEEEDEEEDDEEEEEGVEYLGEVDLELAEGEDEAPREAEAEAEVEVEVKTESPTYRSTFLFSRSVPKTKCCYCSATF
jgi:hypothetical protein